MFYTPVCLKSERARGQKGCGGRGGVAEEVQVEYRPFEPAMSSSNVMQDFLGAVVNKVFFLQGIKSAAACGRLWQDSTFQKHQQKVNT